MDVSAPLIRNISDTALWIAAVRARENELPKGLFRDPLARRLAGERGFQILEAVPHAKRIEWALVTRTYLIDQFISEQVHQGVDTVLHLGAGLDTRPYRMTLPATLHWIEVDLSDLLDYKEEVLGSEKSVCALERVRLDLRNGTARRELFDRLGRAAKKVLVVTEGLLVYLDQEEVVSLGQDLSTQRSFQRWILELHSPRLLVMSQRSFGQTLNQANASFKFAPKEGPEFFTRLGWKPMDIRSMLKTAARMKRLPWWMRLLAWLPDPKGRPGSRAWAGVCLFTRWSDKRAH
jgi:methyltransferase (TIGR00027 family)